MNFFTRKFQKFLFWNRPEFVKNFWRTIDTISHRLPISPDLQNRICDRYDEVMGVVFAPQSLAPNWIAWQRANNLTSRPGTTQRSSVWFLSS